jgi:hypothetical protein
MDRERKSMLISTYSVATASEATAAEAAAGRNLIAIKMEGNRLAAAGGHSCPLSLSLDPSV